LGHRLDYVSQPDSQQPPRDYWAKMLLPSTVGRKPAPATVLDVNTDGTPKPWRLPKGAPAPISIAGQGTVTLAAPVAMTVNRSPNTWRTPASRSPACPHSTKT